MCGFVFLISIFSLPSGNQVLAAVTFSLIGIGVIPIMAVGYAFSVELAYPLPEVMVNGMMVSIALIWGTVQGILD